jgi:hypothetical protein
LGIWKEKRDVTNVTLNYVLKKSEERILFFTLGLHFFNHIFLVRLNLMGSGFNGYMIIAVIGIQKIDL